MEKISDNTIKEVERVQREREIKEYVKNFFETHTSSDGFVCMREIKEKFGIDTVDAYSYVSKHYEKIWK